MQEKTEAILNQKIEFLETQLVESKSQNEENIRAHQSVMNALHSKEKDQSQIKEQVSKDIEQMKKEHFEEIQKLESEFSAQRKRLQLDSDDSLKKNNDLELQNKLIKNELQKELENLTQSYDQLKAEYEIISTKNSDLEKQKMSIMDQTEARYKSKIIDLEKEIEERDEQGQIDVNEIQQKSEESLAQLKNFYEIEKERLEKRVIDEKEKGQTRLANLQEEYEQRLKDEQMQQEDDLNMLRDDISESEMRLQSCNQQFDHEKSLDLQTIESLSAQLKETKDALNNLQQMNSNQQEVQSENFNKERKSLMDKMDESNKQLTNKERQITHTQNLYDSLKENFANREKEYNSLRDEHSLLVKSSDEKIEALKKECQNANDELMKNKLEVGRDQALKEQQFEFLTKKIEDLQKQNKENQTVSEEKLKSLREDLSQDSDHRINRVIEEKAQIESKYEAKREALKQLEARSSKEITKLERENAIMSEKIDHISSKKEEDAANMFLKIKGLEENSMQKEKMQHESKKTLGEENAQLKDQIYDREKQINEWKSKYDRESALWEGKFNFLQDQKENIKKDLAENQKKFEQALAQLQMPSQALVKQETDHTESINRIKIDHKQQVKDLHDSHQMFVKELTEKNRGLEKTVQ